MDGGIVLTAIGTVIAIAGVNVALISWLRADIKSFETEIRGWKDQFSRDMASYKNEINKEMRDFHGRLCSIEERNSKQK
jgi:hypothetical protein